jgi:hypothetical protein
MSRSGRRQPGQAQRHPQLELALGDAVAEQLFGAAPSPAAPLETEAVPPGHPVMHECLPDIEGFYKGWLGRELPGRGGD